MASMGAAMTTPNTPSRLAEMIAATNTAAGWTRRASAMMRGETMLSNIWSMISAIPTIRRV